MKAQSEYESRQLSMLARHVFGYAPSLIIPALTAFGAIFCYTRLLSPQEYGHYALALNAMTIVTAVFYNWLQTALPRLMPQAIKDGRALQLRTTTYFAYAGTSIVMLVVAGVVITFVPLGDLFQVAWLAVPLALMRSMLNMNQAFHRSTLDIGRYNVIECGQALLGLGVGLTLVYFLNMGNFGAVLGLIVGMACMTLVDIKAILHTSKENFSPNALRAIAQFGLPLVVTYGLYNIISNTDRFIIDHFHGPAQVGVYAAGFSLVDRVNTILFMMIATPSYPLTVHKLENEGIAAARDQTYRNGVAVLGLALPACVGFMLANQQITAVLIGSQFRDGAIKVIPWIATGAILNGLSTHYFDHAFHLSKKSYMLLFTQGPTAVFNLTMNFMLIPRFGYMGAAYTYVASYVILVTLSVLVGRRVFKVRFPFRPALEIAASVGIMAVPLMAIPFRRDALGLAEMVVLGGFLYSSGLVLFNVMGVREKLFKQVGKMHVNVPSAEKTVRYDVKSTEEAVLTLAAGWRRLHAEYGRDVFTDFDLLMEWWRTLGKPNRCCLRIACAWEDNRLVGILPLATRKKKFLRMLEWAGTEVLDYPDILVEEERYVAPLWEAIRRAGRYDFALIKDVRSDAVTHSHLDRSMNVLPAERSFYLTCAWPSGAAWVNSLSRKLRGGIRRKRQKLEHNGRVQYQVYKPENGPVPQKIIDAMIAQKLAWHHAQSDGGVFDFAGTPDFMRGLVKLHAARGSLFLAWLEQREEIIACHMGFIRQGTVSLYLTSYKDTFASASPGNMIMQDSISWAIDNGITEFSFLRGGESYKLKFANNSRSLAKYIRGRTWIGQLVVYFYLRGWIGKSGSISNVNDSNLESDSDSGE
jgi:O-antigen/teichoic acid export membrane protein/CelD/BcsL family acetyltransferase involved in cellulose biosynthesis